MELKLRTGESFPELIQADAGKIRQVMTNLVGNAVKFTSVAQVTLSIELDQSDPGRQVALVVFADTGIGIFRNGAAHIFEPFT